MGVFRLTAFIFFLAAGLAEKGWLLDRSASDASTLIAFGLAAYVLSGLAVPSVPTRG